jgi:glycosyltransferase involved in cell wall biosynthesis
MTTIVINAISVKEGGSLIVLRELLDGMSALRPQWHWQVVVNSEVTYAPPNLPNVNYLNFPEIDSQPLRIRLWYETGLPNLLKRVHADLLFSQTNYLPWRHMPCPTLLLVQHAGHFSPLFCKLTEERLSLPGRLVWRLKGCWVKSSILRANTITVQTEALARRIVLETGRDRDHVHVVPHGSGQAALQSLTVAHPAPGDHLRVGYITKHGVQKNFARLFAAAALLKEKQIPLTLVLTLPEQVLDNQAVLESVRQHGVAECIENHGELSPEAIDRLYKSLHVFVFPSLCESFGFPMVEAMAHGIPLLVADVDSNVEVSGTGGIAFPAHDAIALAQELVCLANDPDWFRRRALASLSRGAEFSWGKAAAETLSLMEETITGQSDKMQGHE